MPLAGTIANNSTDVPAPFASPGRVRPPDGIYCDRPNNHIRSLIMTMAPRLIALVVASLSSAFSFIEIADAQVRYGNCTIEGTPPWCAPSCSPGFVARPIPGITRGNRWYSAACIVGYQLNCCEPMGSVSQPQTKAPTHTIRLHFKSRSAGQQPAPSRPIRLHTRRVSAASTAQQRVPSKATRACPAGTAGAWPRCYRRGG